MTDRHIVAMGGGGFSYDDPVLDRYVLHLVSAGRPKVCLLPTAAHFAGTELLEAVASRPGAGAYRVTRDAAAGPREEPIPTRTL